MQELVGRLTAVDAEATETLKVIAYFDALVDGHATTEVLLRGAAILSGCPAGQTVAGRTLRVDATGARSPGPQGEWRSRSFSDGGVAWLERTGAPHANDEMILERLAIALAITHERTSPAAASRRAIETLIDDQAAPEARMDAARRLHLDPLGRYRVVATPGSLTGPATSVVVGTRFGAVRVSVGGDAAPADRAGVGLAMAPTSLDRSWSSALIALRLSSARQPVVRADDLGALLLLAAASDSETEEVPDVSAVRRLLDAHPGAEAILDAIAATDSLRAAGVETGLHHSTVQAKASSFSEALGFDLRSAGGRLRLALALAGHRLATARFD